ncbi:hypothetical protein R1flu_006502 [Riccia fluitans]|uniref:Uncharacterized protein n=1 Tax=Riccia fluitans TaxID=41844 RepID=A0ABD1YWE7_9MARC
MEGGLTVVTVYSMLRASPGEPYPGERKTGLRRSRRLESEPGAVCGEENWGRVSVALADGWSQIRASVGADVDSSIVLSGRANQEVRRLSLSMMDTS